MRIWLTREETAEIKEEVKEYVARCLRGECTPAESAALPAVLDVLNS
ncbi:hypothetical protein [Synergistes jonesii]